MTDHFPFDSWCSKFPQQESPEFKPIGFTQAHIIKLIRECVKIIWRGSIYKKSKAIHIINIFFQPFPEKTNKPNTPQNNIFMINNRIVLNG